VTVLLVKPVAAFRMFTWAFAITAPELSRTTPVTVAVSTICALSAIAPANSILNTTTRPNCVITIPFDSESLPGTSLFFEQGTPTA
jgi:hypothetical protein